ncbi:MAG TPA: DUF3078 domain-containing protein [Chitinophagaceae bacterium]|nr:DUF3078 domain-containing protein [Chitinophagaceae bacterium]MCB9054876.1 DUF3078 domain-containing protein [Chitinophagales bacterium]HPG11126.1 DUF3078 domain-containing protein [Chitinophagaceae bacterium]
MKKTIGLVLLICTALGASAQDASIRKLQTESLRTIKKDVTDTSQKPWKTGGIYNFSVGQGSLSNWAAGGEDFSFSAATALNLFAFLKHSRTSWDNVMNINFGYINTSSLGGRKNDDRIDIVSKYGYALNKKLNLSSLINFRTQLLNGYTYTETAKDTFTKNFSSAFLSPAYALISQGLDYKPGKGLSIFISPVTSRWVIVMDDSLSARGEYGVTPGEHSLNQLGAFATVNYTTAFNKFITYKGRLDLFSNYKNNPLNTDLYMTNVVSAKLGKIVHLSWNLDMIYDDDVKLFGDDGNSPALQLKSIFGVGLQVKI